MRLRRISAKRLAAHALTRPEGYQASLRPALVRFEPGGVLVYDIDHPAWLAAQLKYRGVELTMRTKRPCGCGKAVSIAQLTGQMQQG